MNLTPPPSYTGNAESYSKLLQSFLFQLTEKLNVALEAIDSGTFSDTSSARKGAPVITPGGSGGSGGIITPETKQAYEELKALIKNTAEYSRHEIAILDAGLQTTNGNVTVITNRTTAVEGRASALETGLETTDGNVTALSGRTFNVEVGLATTNTNVSTLGGRTDALESGLEETNGNVTELEDRTGTLETGLETTDGKVDGLEAQLGTVITRTGQLETGITTVQAEIDAANETAAEHWNSFQAYSQRTDQSTTQLEYGIARIDESMSAQFGYYGEQVTNLKTRSDMIENQQLTYDSLLVAQDARIAGFDTYRMTTEGFIRQGFIAQGEGEPPIIGIAIGQNATTSVTKTIDGITYYEANTEEAVAFYTAQKVSFYLHGMEVAYISNENLYINSANIIKDVTVGNFEIKSSPTTGLTVKWVGA